MSNGSLRNLTVSYEAAYEAVAELSEKEETALEGVTMYSGIHPEHGAVHIVIPMMGDGLLLLPFAIHSF